MTQNISGTISVTDITKFTGDTVVSGPVCQPNAYRSGIGEEELYWQFEGTNIPIAISGEGDHSGF